MAKGKKPAAPVAPSSNWKTLRAVRSSRDLVPAPPAHALLASKQAIKPVSAAAAQKDLNKRKRRHSSVGSDASSAFSERPRSKGKEKQRSDGADDRGERAKKAATHKRMVPVDDIMAGGSAAWQKETGQYLAIDCEMVGVGPEGVESTLARVSIVNYHGCTILDRFVRPRERVTDYRTWVSGVREEDLRNAPSFQEVQKEVSDLLKDRILIGHALSNDTTVLLLSHPRHLTRDTSKYAPLQGLAKTKRPGLKTLAKLALGIDIQAGEHSSVTDARATMAIYRSQKPAWEDALLTHKTPSLLTNTTPALQSLDLTNINLTGVGKKRQQHLGLAATLRHEKHLREDAEHDSGDEEEKEELVEDEKRKKRRVEKNDDLVLGFDFEAVKETVVAPVLAAKANGAGGAPPKKKQKATQGGKGKGAARPAMSGDMSKRPAARDSWWEED
ncbi:3'-5' exonuclease [Rhodotorula kratochvilovae]